MEQQNGKKKAGGQLSRGGNICHDKDTSPLRTSTHNLKPPSPVLTRITTIVRVNQNKRPTDQNKKSGDPNPRKQSWGTIPNSEYSFDRGENPSPRHDNDNQNLQIDESYVKTENKSKIIQAISKDNVTSLGTDLEKKKEELKRSLSRLSTKIHGSTTFSEYEAIKRLITPISPPLAACETLNVDDSFRERKKCNKRKIVPQRRLFSKKNPDLNESEYIAMSLLKH
ncbi:hypothetical protein ABEB36_015039 [Hypothenemus hampei]|uniref:Uncharacterized protein n=1 Tax=Hypothenemus hampei TaxID=57062 RepID=A0ABD1E691_HYPHA